MVADARLEVAVRHRRESRGGHFLLDVSFRMTRDMLLVFGAPGSGKSLALQCIAGLVRPQHARVRLGSRMPCDTAAGVDVPSRERRVGYVFQHFAMFPHLNVESNVASPLARLGRALSPESRARVHEVLRVFEVERLAHSYPSQLSGGQRQRVALARSMVRQPDMRGLASCQAARQ